MICVALQCVMLLLFIRIYTRKEAVASTNLALNNAVDILKELERYVDYKYELPALYHAALPDFNYGR